jgi:hypothetical protein
MGNITTKDIGDTQQKVGEVGATIGVVTATIFGVILILIGIGAIIMAFIPMSTCLDNGINCITDDQCVGEDKCDHNTGKCVTCDGKKTKHYWFIGLGIFLIAIAIGMMWFSRWWSHYSHTNRTAAQIGAVGMEVGWLRDIFHH